MTLSRVSTFGFSIAAAVALFAIVPTATAGWHPTVLQTYEADPSRALPEPLGRSMIQVQLKAANECMVRQVHETLSRNGTADLSDLIVEAVPACVEALRTLADLHDRTFGRGTGEHFVAGPFLDNVARLVRQPPQRVSPGRSATLPAR